MMCRSSYPTSASQKRTRRRPFKSIGLCTRMSALGARITAAQQQWPVHLNEQTCQSKSSGAVECQGLSRRLSFDPVMLSAHLLGCGRSDHRPHADNHLHRMPKQRLLCASRPAVASCELLSCWSYLLGMLLSVPLGVIAVRDGCPHSWCHCGVGDRACMARRSSTGAVLSAGAFSSTAASRHCTSTRRAAGRASPARTDRAQAGRDQNAWR